MSDLVIDAVLAIDIGTSSIRAFAYDRNASVIKGLRVQIEHKPDISDGGSTFDPEQFFYRFVRCLEEMMALSRGVCKFHSVGITTFWHSMVGLDSVGQPVTPIVTWADQRPAQEAIKLHTEVDATAWHAISGCAIHPSYYPSRIKWAVKEFSIADTTSVKWASPAAFILSRLFGRLWESTSIASATGLFDQNANKWSKTICQTLVVETNNLPEVSNDNQPVIGLQMPFADQWPELNDIPWSQPIGDGAASNLGSGCHTQNMLAINLGTSGAIRALFKADQFAIPDSLWCYRLNQDYFVSGGAFSDGGDTLAWLRDLFGIDAVKSALAAIVDKKPAEHGLTYLPFLAGERSTGWRPSATATIHGLRQSTAPIDILQASMEGVALRFKLVYIELKACFPEIDTVIASGGALAAAPAWSQMLANCLGTSVEVAEESEMSCRGAALTAMKDAGWITNWDDVPLLKTRAIMPESQYVDLMDRELQRQQALYEKLS
ncbi:MAG: FGGY family carbohydrate kinase [Chthonomonadales bacterium]